MNGTLSLQTETVEDEDIPKCPPPLRDRISHSLGFPAPPASEVDKKCVRGRAVMDTVRSCPPAGDQQNDFSDDDDDEPDSYDTSVNLFDCCISLNFKIPV